MLNLKNHNINFIIDANSLSKNNLDKYSKFKFGDKNEVAYFSKKITQVIQRDHGFNFDNYVLYTPSRKSKFYVNSNDVLCDLISKKIKIKKINGFYSRVNSNKNIFDEKQSIKLRKKSFSTPNIQSEYIDYYQGKNVIIVDDSFVTGLSYKSFLEDVKKLNPNSISAYFIIDFTKINQAEEYLNNYHFKDSKTIINYINKGDYYLTTTLIRRLNKEVNNLDLLDADLIKAFSEYYS